jgi:hypothetical protein
MALPPPRSNGFAARSCAIAFVLLGWTLSSHAQAPTEPALRAAFLYNFAKFTDWPADRLPPGAPIEFCVAEAAVADALQALVAGRSIGDHHVAVSRIKLDSGLGTCVVLYTGEPNAKRIADLLAPLAGSSVLSVGDSPQFIAVGGIVRLFMNAGQMRFAINVEAADRAKLHLSSQLLALATIVRDGADRNDEKD